MTLCWNVMARDVVASVEKIRGKATMLRVGDMNAIEVVVGAKIYEDTSILTQPKSVVIVRFLNGSTMTIAPSSKVVIADRTPGHGDVVGLLTGKLRAVVKDKGEAQGKEKFFVKSRSASMGVRGTEFQATYNNTNNITSLLTYRGNVALKRLPPTTPPVTSSDVSQIVKSGSVVKEGEYSGASPNLIKETVPVKISPEQFTLLKLNSDFSSQVKISKEELKKEIDRTIESFSKSQSSEYSQKEGTYNPKQNSFRPRSGGYIDLNTGIYVQPSDASVLDEKTKVYRADKKLGKLDMSGQYLPPEGVKLDEMRGFVPKDNSEKSKEVVSALNKQIAAQLVQPVVPSKKSLDNIEDVQDEAYELYFKN